MSTIINIYLPYRLYIFQPLHILNNFFIAQILHILIKLYFLQEVSYWKLQEFQRHT